MDVPGVPAMPDPIRVLVVDDSADIVTLCRRLIDKEPGMRCVGTLCSAEGLEQAVGRECPHVLVLDLSMPGPDPLAAARTVARVHPKCRILAFSGHEGPEVEDEVFRAGAWGLVPKSGTHGDLIAAIRRVARGEPAFGPPPNGPQPRG